MDIVFHEANGQVGVTVTTKSGDEEDSVLRELLPMWLESLTAAGAKITGVQDENLTTPEPIGPEQLRDVWVSSRILDHCARKYPLRRSTLSASVDTLALAVFIARFPSAIEVFALPDELLLMKLESDITGAWDMSLEAASLVWFMEQTAARRRLVESRWHYGSGYDAYCEHLVNFMADKPPPDKALVLEFGNV